MEINKHSGIHEFRCESFYLLLASSRNRGRHKKDIEVGFLILLMTLLIIAIAHRKSFTPMKTSLQLDGFV